MKRLLIAAALVAVATFGAHAQATRTWVSGVGDDVNPCSRTAPCKTFAGAISKTAAGGIINALDPAGYGAVTMVKSITLDGSGTHAHILNTGTNGINVNGAGVAVIVRNIGISAGAGGTSGINGIRFVTGSSLIVEDTVIEDQLYASGGHGINFAPTTTASLTVRNVKFSNASAGTGAAIKIVTGGQSVNVTLENVQVAGGIRGIVIDTTGGGWAKVNIENSSFTNIVGPAIYGTAGSGNIRLYLDDVSATNSNVGVVMAGANAMAWMTQSKIAGNVTGIQQAGGAKVYSYKDNQIFNNSTDGTPLPASPTPVQALPDNQIASAAGK